TDDISDQVVIVSEILERLAAWAVAEIVRFGVALAAQALQTKRMWIVGVAGHDAVAVGDERALAFGVVGDALDIKSVVQEDFFQPTRIVVGGAQFTPLPFHVLRQL